MWTAAPPDQAKSGMSRQVRLTWFVVFVWQPLLSSGKLQAWRESRLLFLTEYVTSASPV